MFNRNNDYESRRTVWQKRKRLSLVVAEKIVFFNGVKPLREQNEVIFEDKFPKMKANLLVDLLFRTKLMVEKIQLVHAACVWGNKGAILIPAWKGTGKTAACLKLIENGYSFLGDDKVWLSSKGTVYSYPRYVVIKESNIRHLWQFVDHSLKLKIKISKMIRKLKRYIRVKLMWQVIDRLLKVPARHYHIEDLYPNAQTKGSVSLSNVVYLTKGESVKDIVIQRCDCERTASAIVNINNVEWNYQLLDLATAHDVLFPNTPSWVAEIEQLMANEKTNILNAIRGVNNWAAILPSEDDRVEWADFVKRIGLI